MSPDGRSAEAGVSIVCTWTGRSPLEPLPDPGVARGLTPLPGTALLPQPPAGQRALRGPGQGARAGSEGAPRGHSGRRAPRDGRPRHSAGPVWDPRWTRMKTTTPGDPASPPSATAAARRAAPCVIAHPPKGHAASRDARPAGARGGDVTGSRARSGGRVLRASVVPGRTKPKSSARCGRAPRACKPGRDGAPRRPRK